MWQRRAQAQRAKRLGVFARFGRLAAVLLPAALLVGPVVVAQVAPPESTPAPGTSPPPAGEGGRRVGDIATRYKFLEHYSPNEDPADPQAIVQARVAIRETIRTESDRPQGAPDRQEVTAQTIYTERPAEIGSNGQVAAVVRHYDTFRLKPDPAGRPNEPRRIEGLSLWYQPRGAGGPAGGGAGLGAGAGAGAGAVAGSGNDPLVICQDENRHLRDDEFTIITRQVFLPELSGVLPTLPSRIGDRWRVPRRAAQALLGAPLQQGENLTATFQDLRAEANGPNLVAIIAVTGQASFGEGGGTALNAQLQFAFPPPAAPGDEASPTLDARGAIVELRAAQVTTLPLPGGNGRLRQTRTRELILARRRDNAPTLALPEPKPIPTEANSWLTFVDPGRRFHFLHPQTFRPDLIPGAGPLDPIDLVRQRAGEPDTIEIRILPKTGDPEQDRRNLDPEFHRREAMEAFRQDRLEFIPGASRWLPEADWKPLGLKVHRFEFALPTTTASRANAAPPRLYADYYLIVTSRAESFFVIARTLQDPPADFRKETEAILKTLRFGPPETPR